MTTDTEQLAKNILGWIAFGETPRMTADEQLQLASGFLDMKKERNSAESECDSARVRDDAGVPTEMAVLRREYLAQQAQLKAAEEALERIEKWQGEFPDTGRKWEDGTPMSYGAAFGSNGERDFMRGIARTTLATIRAKGPQPEKQP